MNTTWLTKRRAVDHCRVRSSLCRPCWHCPTALALL